MTTVPPVVDPSWCADHGGVVFCDVRWYLDGSSGAVAYASGHVPDAVFVDLDVCLAAPPSPEEGRHPLPDPATFARCLGAAGIGDADLVVAYDDAGGAYAARLVWLLRIIGAEAALLDGGLAAWTGPLESGVSVRPPVERTPVPWPQTRFVDADGVASRDAGTVLIDARAPQRYRGETEPIDARPGHIPGAVNVPTADNLDPATSCFLSPTALRELYGAVGVGDPTDVVCYCGSGVTACHDLLALEHAGFDAPARLYPGSWSQWSADPSRPAAY